MLGFAFSSRSLIAPGHQAPLISWFQLSCLTTFSPGAFHVPASPPISLQLECPGHLLFSSGWNVQRLSEICSSPYGNHLFSLFPASMAITYFPSFLCSYICMDTTNNNPESPRRQDLVDRKRCMEVLTFPHLKFATAPVCQWPSLSSLWTTVIKRTPRNFIYSDRLQLQGTLIICWIMLNR